MWNLKFFESDGVTPLPGVVFVDNTRSVNGTGTQSSPYNNLTDAVNNSTGNSSAGTDEFGFPVFSRTFALADGIYSEFEIGANASNLMQVEANNDQGVEFIGTGTEYVLNRGVIFSLM